MAATAAASTDLTLETLAEYDAAFASDSKNLLAANALANTDVLEVLQNERAAKEVNHEFSHRIEREGKATSQKSTGRCWMFAGLNVMRLALMDKYKLADSFELSQSYLLFFDKLEKANWYLENVISTVNEDQNSRLFDHLNSDPLQDGGQWDMFVNLVNKYGVVPQSVARECHSSSNTRRMRWFLTCKLREYASRLRSIRAQHGDDFAGKAAAGGEMRAAKKEMMGEIYNILCVHLGRPVRSFEWSFSNKDKEHTAIPNLTPQAFARDIVPLDVNDYVSLVHDPRNEYSATYTVEYLGNVVGGNPVLYLNLPIQSLKDYARDLIKGGSPVWFGCDVGKRFHRNLGVMSTELWDYDLLYGTSDGMTKAERLIYGESAMTHAMVFTGVDDRTVEVNGEEVVKPTLQWRVENSWGADVGDSGYMIMSDNWFSEFLYQIVVPRTALSEEDAAALEKAPTALPPWDPMGALAGFETRV